MRVQLATEAAPGRAYNEDHAFHHGDLVGVLDGVSVPAGVETGCRHGPTWYVHRLAEHLAHTATSPEATLVDALAAAISHVRGDHGSSCDLDHPNTPAATITLVRQTGHQLDYLLLCDAHLILDLGSQLQVVTDNRFARAVADIRQTVLTGAAAFDSPEHDAGVRRAAQLRQQLTNQPDGYWIAAANPNAAHHAITGHQPLTGPDRIRRAALLTDGAANAVDRYSLFDWTGLLDFLTNHGPSELIHQVRHAETADQTGQQQPRYKRHDDATAALCLFEE